MFGFYNILKPRGPTSQDVVTMVKRRLPRGVKAGHAGTLDPLATGVLPVDVGNACRLVSYLQQGRKSYRATVMLGAVSSTDDSQGQITAAAAQPPPLPAVSEAMAALVGTIQQVPPAHSAILLGGQRAYKLARSGRQFEIPPRAVQIYRLELLRYEYPLLEIDVDCGSGTYIRSLARDIGAALGVGGYCQELTRTAVGAFTLADAVTLEQLDVQADLLSPLTAMGQTPKATVAAADLAELALGRAVPGPQGTPSGVDVAILSPQGELIAIGRADEAAGVLRPSKVFLPQKP